jgi:ATP-binding protein involved in chromosome partitioning
MADPTKDQVEAALARVVDPHIDSDLVAAKAVKNIAIDGGSVKIEVVLGYPALGWCEKLAVQLRDEVLKVDGVTDVDIDIQTKIAAHAVQTRSPRARVASASRRCRSTWRWRWPPRAPRSASWTPTSTVPVSHACSACRDDRIPTTARASSRWSPTRDQLIHETNWKDVDYLIIDLPPGTGDVQLTLAQKIPVSGAVIVTTPQEIALLDARKGLKMFEKVEVPVLGIVENMSTHVCSSCGHEEHIFGAGGGVKMAEQADVTFLGALPLDMRIREETDNGRPTVVAEPESTIAQSYRAIARRVAGKLSMQAKNFAARFPSIVIDNA